MSFLNLCLTTKKKEGNFHIILSWHLKASVKTSLSFPINVRLTEEQLTCLVG